MLDGIVGHHGHGLMQQGSECGQCARGDQNDPAQMFQKDLQHHRTYSFMWTLALTSNGQSSWLWLWFFSDFA
jgi:hypothetical protein